MFLNKENQKKKKEEEEALLAKIEQVVIYTKIAWMDGSSQPCNQWLRDEIHGKDHRII